MSSGNNEQLVRLAEVSRITSLGKSTINLWVAKGKFPMPIMLSSTVKVWRIKQIEEWIEAQSTQNQPLTADAVHNNSEAQSNAISGGGFA